MKEILKKLVSLDGVAGFEDEVRDYIESEIKDHVDEMFTDSLGNLYAFKKGKKSGKKLLVCTHMDEVGFLVHRITDDGMLKITRVGGIDPRVLIGRRMKVGFEKIKGVISIKAIHLTTPESRKTAPGLDSLYIDIGASSKKEAEKYVRCGDPVYFDSDYVEFGDNRIKAKAIDDRIGCAIMVDIIKGDIDYDCWFAFTVQEEIGLRGARVVGNRVNPDICMVLEGTTAADLPNVEPHKQASIQGKGPAISLIDGGTIHNRELREALLKKADEKGIKWHYRFTGTGGNDMGAVHTAKEGCIGFGVSAPARYIHSAANVLYWPDAVEMEKMAKLFISEAGNM